MVVRLKDIRTGTDEEQNNRGLVRLSDIRTEENRAEYKQKSDKLKSVGLDNASVMNSFKNMAANPSAIKAPTTKTEATTTKKSSGIKGLADKIGLTKDLKLLGQAASDVFNAPGNLIRSADKSAQNLVTKLPGANKGKPLYDNGESIGQHLQSTIGKTNIPGVTNGPVANFIRGAADASDFGVGRALDEVLGNQQALQGRNTKAARVGEIAGTVAPLGALGASLVSKGVKAAANSLKGTLEDVTRNQLQALKAANVKEIPSRLTVPGAQQQLDKVMEEIRPIVTERITPPLENENELAKWVRTNFDPNISLNEVRKLTYNDLHDMASELAKRPDFTYNEAVRVAGERGYDLPALLEGKGNTIAQKGAQIRSQRAYGVRMDELPSVRRNGPNLTLPEVQTQPNNMSWFQRLFGNQGLGITAGGGTVKIGTQQQIVGKAIKNDTEGITNAVKTAGRNTYQTLVDSLSPIKRVFGQQAYDIAMDSNRASNLANTIIHDKFVDPEGNVLGKGMSEIFKQIPRGLDNEAVDYLILRDAKDRVGRGEKVYEDRLGMNDVTKINQRIANYEAKYPALKNLGTDWDDFTRNIRQVYGLDSGLLNADQVAAMEAARPNYAPMRRQFKLSERVKRSFGGTNTGFSGQKAPIQAVSPTGSARKIVDPRRTMMEATQKWVQNSMNNRVMQYIGDEVMANPDALKDIAEIVRTETKTAPKLAKAFADADELKDAIANGNEEEFLDDLSKQFRKLFDKSKAGDDTVLTYMKNGQPVAIRIKDPESIRALASLGPQQTGVIVKALGALSNLTKRSATGLLAPLFAVRQLTVDLPQALIQSPNAVAHLGDYAHALVSSMVEAIPGLRKTKLADLANDFRRTGGVYSSLLKTEKGVNKSMKSLKRNAFLSPEGIAQGVTSAVKAPFKALEKFGDVAENLNRMAAFKGSMRSAGGVRTPENVRDAITAAREITTNFSRKGTAAKELESLIPYNNAAVQGLRRFLTAYKNHPIKATIGTLSLAVAPKMLEYATFGNDPDYQNIPARDRYRKLFIAKRPDGSFVSLQMPPEYNAIGAFTEDLMRRFIGDDPQSMRGVADALMNAYTPPAVAGLAQGITQGGGLDQSIWGGINATSPGAIIGTAANQSFTGSPIVPQSMQDVSPQFQYDEKTTAAAKELGKALNWSPKKIDYLLRQYTGDIGRYILPLTSTTGSADTVKSLAKNFITDPVYTNTLADQYYRAKDLVSRVEADNKAVGKALPSWYSDNIHKLISSTAKGTTGAQLKELNTQKKALNADNTMSIDEKARKLRDIQMQINSIYTDILSQLEEAKVPITGR
ncbi:LPD38 domain-containing protein [Cohnella zeiphila]|uniref:Large polyvalent protein associated domain-containing protein n=1 Tax=Cohnella zeiphila TaxID=2761120 RepID=A0A7X0SL05_9BACL|nr:LPD38 domain-containing protein [Cohnella zeiphila]MBB6731881.1 hypothetical protein [Cohnella zeiphila]